MKLLGASPLHECLRIARTLVAALAERGYTVIGPTVRDGAIVYEEIVSADELESIHLASLRVLKEIGVEVLHEGAIGRDPIAVRLDDMRVALRRRDAAEVLVRLDPA